MINDGIDHAGLTKLFAIGPYDPGATTRPTSHGEAAVASLKAVGRDIKSAFSAPFTSDLVDASKSDSNPGTFTKIYAGVLAPTCVALDALRVALLPVSIVADVGWAAVQGSMAGIGALSKK